MWHLHLRRLVLLSVVLIRAEGDITKDSSDPADLEKIAFSRVYVCVWSVGSGWGGVLKAQPHTDVFKTKTTHTRAYRA